MVPRNNWLDKGGSPTEEAGRKVCKPRIYHVQIIPTS